MNRSGTQSHPEGQPRTSLLRRFDPRRFNRLGVAHRILVGFAAVLLLVLVLAAAGLGWFRSIDRDVGRLAASSDVAQTVAEADIGLRDLEVSVRDHLTYGDDQSLLDANLRHDGILEKLALLDKAAVDPADRTDLAKARKSLDDYWAAVQRIVALRNERTTAIITVMEPAVSQARERLGQLKNAGGVDSTALSSDAAIAVLLMQEHLSRFLERRDPMDAERMRSELGNARGKLAEMNRYLWIPGTRQAITEVTTLLAKIEETLGRIEAAATEEDTVRAEAMAPNAAGMAANLGEMRRRADARTDALRTSLSSGSDGYAMVAMWVGGLALLIGLLAVWLAQRGVSRPVHAMADAVGALASGRTDVAVPMLDGGDEIAGMARAVETLRTAVVETEQQRREAEAAHGRLLREKERLEAANLAKSDFLVNMGQELHRPITDIINSSQALMGELHRLGVDELATDVEHIQWTGEQLVGLVDALLDYAKIEAGAMDVVLQDFDVNRLLVEVRERSMPAADLYGNSLEIQAHPGLGLMHSDFTKVRQALLNLLDNGCKFTQGGAVVLSADRFERNGATWFRFAVTDSGAGFPAAQTGRLFQPFVQGGGSAKGKRRGAGLGLTLVGYYTAMLGGDVEVASEPGQGTRVTLSLPATYQPPEDERPLSIASPDAAVTGRPLLTVAPLRPVAQLPS